MIRLELSSSIVKAQSNAKLAAEHIFRPISRKYDKLEHTVPVELENFASLSRDAANKTRNSADKSDNAGSNSRNSSINARSMMSIAMIEQLCWGDVGLMLARPGSGLGNAAIYAVGNDEQKAKWGDRYASMAITEPNAGSDSKNISTTAVRDGDEWILNGEKIFVTDGDRSDCVVVWATLNKDLGKAAIRSFVIDKQTDGLKVARLEKKLGIRASDTATIFFQNCRIPLENLLGGEYEVKQKSGSSAFGGAMKTFDNTRPIVASMAIGVGQAAIDMTREQLKIDDTDNEDPFSVFETRGISAELLQLETEVEAARLLTLRSAWMMDNRKANSVEASMAKAKAGRVGNSVSLLCVELLGEEGYSENLLLEKFARDSKILDIFEGTQQIQLLVVARGILGKSSAQLR